LAAHDHKHVKISTPTGITWQQAKEGRETHED